MSREKPCPPPFVRRGLNTELNINRLKSNSTIFIHFFLQSLFLTNEIILPNIVYLFHNIVRQTLVMNIRKYQWLYILLRFCRAPNTFLLRKSKTKHELQNEYETMLFILFFYVHSSKCTTLISVLAINNKEASKKDVLLLYHQRVELFAPSY